MASPASARALFFASDDIQGSHDLCAADTWTHHAGVSIKLPHPLADRLFRQRGVFIDDSGLSPSSLRQLCIEVRFPADHRFRPLRRGYRNEIIPPDPWWQRVVKTAREIADGDNLSEFLGIPAEHIDLVEGLVGSSRIAKPDELTDRFAHSVRELTQMLVAFTISIQEDTVSTKTAHVGPPDWPSTDPGSETGVPGQSPPNPPPVGRRSLLSCHR